MSIWTRDDTAGNFHRTDDESKHYFTVYIKNDRWHLLIDSREGGQSIAIDEHFTTNAKGWSTSEEAKDAIDLAYPQPMDCMRRIRNALNILGLIEKDPEIVGGKRQPMLEVHISGDSLASKEYKDEVKLLVDGFRYFTYLRLDADNVLFSCF